MHLRDYFDKEMKHVEHQLDSLLRNSVDDPNVVPKASLLNPIPKFVQYFLRIRQFGHINSW
jgi:hypothetical protein